MSEIEYLFVTENLTICSGIDNVKDGIETNLKDLVFNKKALEALDLVSIMCDLTKPDYTFEWYCNYFAAFKKKGRKEQNKYYLTNPKIQILCDGELLENLRAAF